MENGRNVCWRRGTVKKSASFRKLFTAIVGAHFKSATEIAVNNLLSSDSISPGRHEGVPEISAVIRRYTLS